MRKENRTTLFRRDQTVLTQLPELQAIFMGLLVLFIAAVSVHDAMLVVLNELVIADAEQNPVGRWLLAASGGNVWPFVGVKLTSTAIVCAALLTVHQCVPRIGLMAAGSVALFQAALLLYLSYLSLIR